MHALAVALLCAFFASSFAAPLNGVDDVAFQLYSDDWVQDDCEVDAPPSSSVINLQVSTTAVPSSSALGTIVPTSAAVPSISSISSISSSASLATTHTDLPYTSTLPETTIAATSLPNKAPASTVSSSAPATSSAAASGKYPFSQIVAFGDNLSDNGNGSYAHCVAAPGDCGNKIYGFGTWTDGPIAVSYLSYELGVPLTTDYAFGHADGGSKFGATIDNAYTQSTANSPSAKDQIATYAATKPSKVADTLHFLWIGANDINLYHINVDSTDNSQFATDMSTRMAAHVQELVSAGAEYVFVPNLYPKHISPSVEFYADTAARVANFGSAIEQANAAIEAALKSFGNQAIYYDAYSFMVNVWNNHRDFGITHVGGEFCDGYSQADWDLCVTDGQGDTFFWMQYLDMTSYVHSLVAADMHKALAANFGV